MLAKSFLCFYLSETTLEMCIFVNLFLLGLVETIANKPTWFDQGDT